MQQVERWKETTTSIVEDMTQLFRMRLKVWTRPCRRYVRRRIRRRTRADPVTATASAQPPILATADPNGSLRRIANPLSMGTHPADVETGRV
ncbi:hypothetical protein EON62_00580, partial [archaeon]